MVSQKTHIKVNGRKYYVRAKETSTSKSVKVYDGRGAMKKVIVSNSQKKGRIYSFGKDTTLPIREMVQRALNEAVCKRENKEEERRRFEKDVWEAISTVQEIHDN